MSEKGRIILHLEQGQKRSKHEQFHSEKSWSPLRDANFPGLETVTRSGLFTAEFSLVHENFRRNHEHKPHAAKFEQSGIDEAVK
jgi:hypothetical protein